jgi:hypothetical protein
MPIVKNNYEDSYNLMIFEGLSICRGIHPTFNRIEKMLEPEQICLKKGQPISFSLWELQT